MQCHLSSKQIYSAMTFILVLIGWLYTIGIDVKYHDTSYRKCTSFLCMSCRNTAIPAAYDTFKRFQPHRELNTIVFNVKIEICSNQC